MHSLFFFFIWKKKMLERNNFGKKEVTLTPSLNMICLVCAGTAAGAGHMACTVGKPRKSGLPVLSLLSFYSARNPSPWSDTSHVYGVSTHLPRRHGQVCLQYLDNVSTPGVQACFQKPPLPLPPPYSLSLFCFLQTETLLRGGRGSVELDLGMLWN